MQFKMNAFIFVLPYQFTAKSKVRFKNNQTTSICKLFMFYSFCRQLAQISRSTRGVILLLANLQATRRIMTEAHRLNMVGGHFIWLWIDTSTSKGYFHQTSAPIKQPIKPQQPTHLKKNNASVESTKSGAEPMENRKNLDKTNIGTSNATINENAQEVNNQKKVKLTTDDPKSSTAKSTSSNKERARSNVKSEDQLTKTNGDFSSGFDPFRVLQRQDEHLKQSFGSLQHYQERTPQRDNKQTTNSNRLILGLRGEGGTETVEPSASPPSKKTRRSNEQENNMNVDINYSGVDDEQPNIFISNQTLKNFIYSKNRNFSDDNLDEFIDNNNFNEHHNLKLNLKHTSATNGSNSSSFINFHQFKDFPVGLLALRPIRMNVDRHFIRAAVRLFAATWEKINGSKSIVNITPPQQRPTSTSSSSSVSSSSTALPQSRRTQQNRAQGTMTLYNAKKFGNEMLSRKMRRKRNIYTVNQLLLVTMEKRSIKSILHSEIAHEHDNEHERENNDGIQTEHQTVPEIMQVNSSLFLKEFSSNDKTISSVIGKRHRRLADNRDIDVEQNKFNSSFTSDLPNNKYTNKTYYFNSSDSLTNVNVSFSRNFSGLWKQNSKDKSNIHSINSTSDQHNEINSLNTESESNETSSLQLSRSTVTNQSATHFNRSIQSIDKMAKQASQSVVHNFFADYTEDIRQPSHKRQNTWWSTKKEVSNSTSQYKRPHYDVNNKNSNQLANAHRNTEHDANHMQCETPSYSGGCYGHSTKQDVKNAEYFTR